MNNKKGDQNCIEIKEQEQMDIGNPFQIIYCSCDVDKTDSVPVSKLIEFIQPFMAEDLNALEELRHSLDPENKNALVNSERFYEAMSLWSTKIGTTASNEEHEFDRSPSRLQVIDDRELPYTHSTPRASLGDKLLRCRDLLNLSNVSGYSLSTSRLGTTSPADSDKTVLEEEIKKLEHQLSKTTNELSITKQQLAASEEQNETFQQDLERLNRRLHAEQQVNELLQKEKTVSEELRDELGMLKKMLEDLKKKLSQSEKDSMYYRDVIDEQDKEKLKIEKKSEILSKQHQDCLKEIFDIKTELGTKEEQMTEIIKVYDDLKLKFAELKDFNDQLREENDILHHQKSTLEKALKAKSSNSPHSNLGNLNQDLSTSSPHHRTSLPHHGTPPLLYNTPHYTSPNLVHQNGTQPKSQSRPLLRQVMSRHSSTPVSLSKTILDSSLPDSVKSVPTLSPVYGAPQEENNQHQDSSEEDLCWKLQQGEDAAKIGQELNGTAECLQTEMDMADSVRVTESYYTILFEKDEQIIELEEELEKLKIYLKEIEDQKNEFLSKLKEQNKINEELIENNFVLATREETGQKKIESLKNRLAQMEKHGVIVENDHEHSQGEIEDLTNTIKMLKEEVKSKEFDIKELRSRMESNTSLKKETVELMEKLSIAQSKIEEYDQRLQAAMRDLGEVSMDKARTEEELRALKEQQQNRAACNAQPLEETLHQAKDLKEKLSQMEQLNKEISDKYKLLEEDNFVLNDDLENVKSKYEHLLKRFAVLEEELCSFKDLNNNKEQEIARCEDAKKQMVDKFEEELRLKDEGLKNILKEKDKELESFKENLEKKIVQEFEGKVKYSMEAEEKIINLNKKCKQLEDNLKNSLSKLSSKGRILADAENKITYLSKMETSLKQEIDSLKTAKTELEMTVSNLKTEQEYLNTKLQELNKIDCVASEIQKHIKDKDVIIEELKQLNKKMECNLNTSQLDLKEKIEEILKLRNEWSKNIDIKNDLWNRVKCLQKENYRINAENRALLEKERQLSSSSEALTIEYNNLLIVFDVEVNKNAELSGEIAELLEKKNYYCNSYDELKIEFDQVVSKYESDNKNNLEKISLSLRECQSKLDLLESQNQELRYKLAQVQKNDNMSQTETVETEVFEEEFSKIKAESDKLLEELESKLNEEVGRNRNLMTDLLDLKQHLDNRNFELLEMKEKISNNESDMVAKLQLHIDNNERLTEELSQTKETLHAKGAEVKGLINRVNNMEKEFELLNEKNIILNQELTDKCKEMENFELQIKVNEATIQAEIEEKNTELLKKLTDVENLLEQQQNEMRCIEDNNQQLVTKLDLTKNEKDKINNDLSEATEKIMFLKEKFSDLQNENNILQEQNQLKMSDMTNRNEQLQGELIKAKQENDTLNKDLQDAASEIFQLNWKHGHLRDELIRTEHEKENLNKKLQDAASEIVQLKEKHGQLQDDLITTKQEKEALNNKLQNTASEVIQLNEKHGQLQHALITTKQDMETLNNELEKRASQIIQLNEKLSENEKGNNKLLIEAKQKLQEEIVKNKAIFDKFLVLKREREQLTLELNDTKTSLAHTKRLCDKKQTELGNLQAKCSELNSKIQIQGEQLRNFDVLLQEEINRNTLERSTMTTELSDAKSSLVRADLELKNMEISLSETRKELSLKCLENERLISELEEAKRKGHGTTDGSSEKEAYKRTNKTYSRQQIAFEKLKDKLEDIENELKVERNKNHELETKLLLSDSKIIGDEEGYKKEIERLQEQLTAKEKKMEAVEKEYIMEKRHETALNLEEDKSIGGNDEENKQKCEGKTVNKFTLAARCQASPDSPSTDIEVNGLDNSRKLSFHTKYPFSINCDSTIEIPSLDVTGFADDIIEELELTDGSPRKKLDMEETEKNVTALTLRLLVNSKDISERIENQTEKYRNQYEEILSLIRDISHRLRDHVCIGTAEPIMPVFVLLEDIKLQLKEVVQSAGQVGVLIYEDRMKKCWNLVTNYMAMLRQENESLHNISRETTPTQTGLVRRRNKCTQEKGDSREPVSYRRRRFLSCTGLTAAVFFLLAFAVTFSIIIHLNCRMTASANQLCPLDGVITRINVGLPPM